MGTAAAAVYQTEADQLDAVDARPGIRMAARVAFANLTTQLTNVGDADAAREVEPLEAMLEQVNMASWSFLVEEDTKQLNIISVNEDTGHKALDAIQERLGGISMVASDLAAARKAFDDYIKSIRDGIAQAQARQKIVAEKAVPAMAASLKMLQEATDDGMKQSQEADAAATAALDSGMGQILIFSIIAILAAIGAALYSVFGIARPISM